MAKQLEYTVKIVTNGTVDTDSLQNVILTLDAYNIASVQVTNFKIVKGSK